MNAETLARLLCAVEIGPDRLWDDLPVRVRECLTRDAEAILASPEWAEHEREVAAKAWREGWRDARESEPFVLPSNPYGATP